MNFLVDTNVVSEWRKGASANPSVIDWFERTPNEKIHVSVLVIGEIRRGIEKLRPRDPSHAAALDNWLGTLIYALGPRLIDFDRAAAEIWGSLSARRSRPPVDTQMAAVALSRGMTVVTRNVLDFADTEVAILNPFEPQEPM